jgi:glycosyltransferase involved in cell wall biosynthesis
MLNPRVLIIMVLPKSPVTGGEIYNFHLIDHLKRTFDSVERVSWQPATRRGPISFIVNSILQNLHLLKYWKSIRSNTVIVEDISQSSDLFLFNVAVRFLRMLSGKKVYLLSIVQQTYSPLMKDEIRRTLTHIEESIFINSSDGIVVNSEFTKHVAEDILWREVQIVVAYPGLNVSGLNEAFLKKPRGGVSQLLFVGYITQRKGVDDLLRSLEILAKEKGMDHLVLNIVGDNIRERALYQELREYSDKAGLGNNVIFRGRVGESELKDLYRTSDLFVFPSYWESFGMVLAEAMSYGLPIVTANAGAIPYLVKDGINGLLVPPKDPQQLAQAIEKLLSSPELMVRFGEANMRVAEQFDWDKSFSKVADLVKSLGSN